MPFFSHSWDRDPVDALLRLQDRLERVFEKPLGFELGLSGRGATPPVNSGAREGKGKLCSRCPPAVRQAPVQPLPPCG